MAGFEYQYVNHQEANTSINLLNCLLAMEDVEYQGIAAFYFAFIDTLMCFSIFWNFRGIAQALIL